MAGFRNILGHSKEIEVLQQAIMLGKVSHAYSFEGEEGSGKQELAEAFAMTLQCEKGAKDACLACPSCRKSMVQSHPDIIYVTHEKPNTISVGDIREQVNGNVYIKPYSSKYKIYIIADAQKMNPQAQNAILKTIEEPPQYVVIILLTTNEEMFLPTIRSRCISMKIKPVEDDLIQEYLVKQLGISQDMAGECTAFAQGNIGKAIRLAGAEDFEQLKEFAIRLLKQMKDMDVLELVDGLKRINDYKLEIDDFMDIMTVWYRDILLYKATQNIDKLIFQKEVLDIRRLADVSSYEGLNQILGGIETAKQRLHANVNLDLVMELLWLTIKENLND